MTQKMGSISATSAGMTYLLANGVATNISDLTMGKLVGKKSVHPANLAVAVVVPVIAILVASFMFKPR